MTHNQKGEATALVVGADNKVEARVLTTERAVGADWLVTKGLNDGDRLIVEGVQKVRPGGTVTVKEAPAPGTTDAVPAASPAPAGPAPAGH